MDKMMFAHWYYEDMAIPLAGLIISFCFIMAILIHWRFK